ncbi:c-type cytochrome [Negadavirga shengliensis]|uniref:C-type cytochrome n=1 Tax=Negadavirga shengliensis TaxID=1389218 RepID=A0ABV9T2V6_9BACT
MKKAFKILIIGVSLLFIMVIGAVIYVSVALPNVGPAPSDYQVTPTPEKIERGKYLAYHVMQCIDCHSQRDFSIYSAPPKPGTEAVGGERFDHSMGFPGVFISPNITPFGIGDWTDGELFRLITTGVKRDGDPIFPVMPYHGFGQLDPEDIEAVIAYIRSLEPVASNHGKSKPDFPINLIMRTMPKKAALTKKPDPSDQLAYGNYLVTASACRDCHTKFEKGDYVGAWLAGGREFIFPDGSVLTTPNLTPHESGLANWTKDMFIQRFKMYSDHSNLTKVRPGEMQTIMPWAMYSGMNEEDLGAIFEYLQSLDPVENYVEKFKPNSNS